MPQCKDEARWEGRGNLLESQIYILIYQMALAGILIT